MASIRKRGNSYLLVVSMGYTPDGRRRNPQQKTVKPPTGLTPKQTEKWLQEQAMLFEMSCKKLNPDIDRSITLENTQRFGCKLSRRTSWRSPSSCVRSRTSSGSSRISAAARTSARSRGFSDTVNHRLHWTSTPTPLIRTRKLPARSCRAAWKSEFSIKKLCPVALCSKSRVSEQFHIKIP